MTSSAELRVSSLFNFSNHVVLVTGGATGLGEMAAQGFVQNGAKVFIASRKESELKKTSDRLNKLGPGTCEYIVADLKDKAGCDGLVKEIKKRTDRLTVLVNNVCVHLSARLGHLSKCLICSRLRRYNFLTIVDGGNLGGAMGRFPREWLGQVDGVERQVDILHDCGAARSLAKGDQCRYAFPSHQYCFHGRHHDVGCHCWRRWRPCCSWSWYIQL